MIEMKEAVKTAHDFINQVYEETKQTELTDLQLEEIERSEDNRFWFVTFGFLRKRQPINELQKVIGNVNERVFKSIKVDAESGQALAMQIKS